MKDKKLRVLHIFLLLFCLVFMPNDLFAYDSEKDGVHDKASQKAWDTAMDKGDFLKDLGLAESDLLYEGKRAKDWVAYGSRHEDKPIVRTVNHFYDPVQKIGLNDPCGFPNILNIPIFPSPSWGLGYVPVLNAWDIKNAREYEYIALTGRDLDGDTVSEAQDDEGRKKYFAHMFRAVGQVMHLIQDCAVPEHVRNDGHALPWDRSLYEAYAAAEAKNLNYGGYQLVKLPAYYCFFDTGPDTLDCEGVSNGMGLAEFTNRNFVSQSTNFDDRGLCRQVAGIYSQPQPEFSNVEEETVPLPEGGTKTFWVHYAGNMVSDLYSGIPPEVNKYLSAYSWWDFEKNKEFNERVYSLNDKCFKATTDFVVPRAVGYSAGLLDYFFRGKLEVTAVPLIAGVIEGSDIYQNNIYGMMLKVKNMSVSQEDMKDGFFVLTCRYTPTGGSPDGSDDIFVETWAASGDTRFVPCEELIYEDEIKLYFYIPFVDFIPIENVDSITCSLAFSGTLGNEAGAVIGNSFSLGEIKFNEEWNNGLDGNYPWYHATADENPDNGSTTNTVANGFLVKDNIRYQGHETARFNESYIEFDEAILITSDTYLNFKIDVVSINEQPPAPPDTTTAWQVLLLRFNNDLWVEFAQEEQGIYINPTSAYYSFTLGLPIVENIYDMFRDYGITIPESLYLEGISFWQQLWTLDDPSEIEHHQHMEVDFIRIIEGKEEKEE